MLTLRLFLVIFNYNNNKYSYECSISATHCIRCDDSNTKRTLSINACPCNIGYFDNGTKVCEPCDYSWLYLIIFKSNSYECLQNANNCISCNDETTFRYLLEIIVYVIITILKIRLKMQFVFKSNLTAKYKTMMASANSLKNVK